MRIGSRLSSVGCVILVAAGFISTPLAAQTLSASPSAVTFSYVAGQPGGVVPQSITISPPTAPALNATLTDPKCATPGSATCLFRIERPGNGNIINVGVNAGLLGPPFPLPAGDYTGSITVTATGFTALTIPLTLRMGSAITLTVSQPTLPFNAA